MLKKKHSILRSVLSVGSFTVLSRIFGFVRDIIQANLFGASVTMDALAIALRVPSFFRKIFAEGSFNASFVPMFAGIYTTQGMGAALSFASSVLSILFPLLVIVVGFIEVWMPTFVSLLTPGFTTERLELAIKFSRITMPFLLFISLNAFYSGILNSLNRFAMAAASPAIGNIALIIVIIISERLSNTNGTSVAIGSLVCGVAQLSSVYIAARNAGVRLVLAKPVTLTPAIKSFLKAMIPGAIGAGASQINLCADMIISSFLPKGSMSYLYYADRYNQLPLSVIGIAISTALLPLMASQIRSNNFAAAQKSQAQALSYAMTICIPATAGLMVLAQPIIYLLMQHGSFMEEHTRETAATLIAFVSGLPAYILVKIFTTVFFARCDTKTPLFVSLGVILLNIILSYIAMRHFLHIGIAAATAVTGWINAAVLGVILWRQGLLAISPVIFNLLLRVIIATIIMVSALMMIPESLYSIDFNHFLPQWLQRGGKILIVGTIGIAAFSLSAWQLGIARVHRLLATA